MLNQRYIESFLILAETLSYTEAARRLYVSHQALSKQILRLEEDLGHVLFSRSTRSVALTAVGELFYSHFKDVATRHANICIEAERLARIQKNDLRIGFPLGIRPPDFLGDVLQKFPTGSVRIEWHDIDALTRRFEAETLDVVFSLDDSGMAVSDEADRVTVAQCSLKLAASKDNPAWDGPDLSAFSGQVFYYEQESTPETTNEMRRTLINILQNEGIVNPQVEMVPNIQSRQTGVELGLGCCLSVDLDTLHNNPLVRTAPLDTPSSSLSCYWRKQTDKPIVHQFIAQFQELLTLRQMHWPTL